MFHACRRAQHSISRGYRARGRGRSSDLSVTPCSHCAPARRARPTPTKWHNVHRHIIRNRVNAGLDRVRPQGRRSGAQGVVEDRKRHQETSERRQRHPQRGGAGWVRQWHRAVGQARDGRRVGQCGMNSHERVARCEGSQILALSQPECRNAGSILNRTARVSLPSHSKGG